MLHGWGTSLEALKPLGQLLSNDYSVHLIDLPGFGQSTQPETVWNSFDYADRIIQYLDENGIAQANVIGHSFGGKVSISLACRHSDRVNNLILVGSSGLRRRRSFAKKCRMQAIKWLGKSAKAFDSLFRTSLFSSLFAPRFGSADYKNANPMMRKILVKSVNEDLSESIALIHKPTLMLWGEQDDETPPEVARRLQSLIQKSQLFIFPGKGHWFYQDGGAHLCAAYILPFLNKDSSHG